MTAPTPAQPTNDRCPHGAHMLNACRLCGRDPAFAPKPAAQPPEGTPTPRTDALLTKAPDEADLSLLALAYNDLADLARTLERETIALRQSVEHADKRAHMFATANAEYARDLARIIDGDPALSLGDNLLVLVERAETAEQSVERLEKEAAWVRRKLKLPEDCGFTSGNPTLAGEMHVVCAHAHGYVTYIEAYKCDDKQGEIARLTVRALVAEQQLNDKDTVPRSRYDACNADWLAAKAEKERVINLHKELMKAADERADAAEQQLSQERAKHKDVEADALRWRHVRGLLAKGESIEFTEGPRSLPYPLQGTMDQREAGLDECIDGGQR